MNAITIIAIILNGIFAAFLLTAGVFNEKGDRSERIIMVGFLGMAAITIVALAIK
jgi:hypothetical protein